MNTVVATISSNFPQTSQNSSVSEILDEIADYEGGKTRPETIERARKTLRRVTQKLNGMSWRFNRVETDFDIDTDVVSGTTNEYTLPADFYKPRRMQLVDSSSPADTREYVPYVDWDDWARERAAQNRTGSRPLMYTTDNIHETGRMFIDPPKATTLTYPTMRLFYFRRIIFPADNAVFNVPQEFEQAIVGIAVADFIAKVRNFREARAAKEDSGFSHQRMIDIYRDFSEMEEN